MSLWAAANAAHTPFGASRSAPGHLEAVERVKEWTRGRFGLAEAEAVLVSETVPSLPGFPPLQSLVAFRSGDGAALHFRVFKPVEEIEPDDIPPAWMKGALAEASGAACDCC
jgi:hypothetical protein